MKTLIRKIKRTIGSIERIRRVFVS